MKVPSWVWFIGGGFVLFKFFNLSKAVDTVQFVFQGITIKSPTNYELKLMVQNITNSEVKLNAFSGIVTVNDSELGNFSGFEPTIIAPSGQSVVKVTVQPSLLSLPTSIKEIVDVANGDGDLEFNIIGNANVNGFILPIDLTYNLKV